MIIYATKQTIDRYQIKMPEEFENPDARRIVMGTIEQEKGDPLLEWGAKIFYFDRRKCVQVCNFASKFTIVLVDMKKAELEWIANAMALYMLDIYEDDEEMIVLLKRLFQENPLAVFSRLTDRRIISTMNRFQTYTLEDGYRLYDFLEDGILRTKKLNKRINKEMIVSDKIAGKTVYFYPKERFAELLKERFR